jgi:hypothetical protein
MAKLYAELSSDKGGRIASKGGDKYITVQLRRGNKNIASIALYPNSVVIQRARGEEVHIAQGYIMTNNTA